MGDDSRAVHPLYDARVQAELRRQASLPAMVTPDDITEQRAKGWADWHPEDYCHRCGRRNPCWWVDSDRWNPAVHALGLTYTAILCPSCFVEGHEQATGMTCAWYLTPDAARSFRPVEDWRPAEAARHAPEVIEVWGTNGSAAPTGKDAPGG